MNLLTDKITIKNKKEFHLHMARLPFEEKLRLIIELQKIDLEFRKKSNRIVRKYERVWKF